ncbi:conserved hypothetical protein [Leishmania mexicana MHOM/GT/2001/U1103]|uniref:C5orf34-like C-terminal domain-containing protein n=1 Tax=Leishmania mexicana (strain MHOM/GT/2001/U1103) TaxID=929439 RepID=E9B4B5_LEIMU|nr:conserved hypothetical protein [Leishmania mexicana MHOM/GT/2001/U1103]CBZ30083.1 conserved hypothetical protein [Leishmania mexicana MHOM/GT/2001/U1103]
MLTPSLLADSVVRAAAWDDGGAEFIFVDGTIMSFVDNMNTFVAVRSNPSPRDAQRAATHAARQRQQEERRLRLSPTAAAAAGEYVDLTDDPKDDDDDNRELCFTAWTLSSDVGKVRAALHIFNSLSEKPRLLTPLLPSETPTSLLSSSLLTASASAVTPAYSMVGSCGVWQEPGPPIDTLLLERRADLFRRYVVLGTVRQWMPVSAAAPQRESAVPSAARSDLPQSESCLIGATAAAPLTVERAAELRMAKSPPEHIEYGDDSSATHPKEVPVGTVLELWCALRRVCMTVAVHRETFTVRWPAPVTRSDGSRLPLSFHALDTATLHLSPVSPSWSSSISPPGSASAPLLFTYMEQTFPVRDPPDAWRTMLQLALELDAELPGEEREGSAPSSASASPSHTTIGAVGTECDENVGRSASWHGCLPEPHRWSGALNQHRNTNPCRFSRLTASQAAHLAAPRTTRAVDAMRALHPRGSRLCWMYEASHCGSSRESPSAVYWCVQGSAVTTPIKGNLGGTAVVTGTSTAASLRGTEVVAWVAEDGSVVRTTLEGQGYTIRHHRLHLSSSCATAPAPAVYRLQAHDTAAAMMAVDKRLPSTITPLRCHIHVSPPLASTQLHNGGEVLQSCCALSPRATLHLRGDPNSRSSPHGDTRKKDTAAAAAASAAATASPEAFAVAIIDPQSLHCAPAFSTDGIQRACTAATVTPACACSALAALTALLVSSEQRIPGYMDSHCNAAAGALFLASQGKGVTCGKLASLEASDAVRRLRLGRYVASVVDVAIQLSQVNCAAKRAADAARPSTDQPRLAAYCCSGPAATSRPCWSTSGHDLSCRKGALSAAATANSSNASAASVVYLTSRLDGIGTFTALTNGTIRVHFDDRTLLTLVPGVNEVDEEELLATCVLRNATRCTMRAAQCHPGHAMHRYLAYALPFRRYVYWKAVHPHETVVMDGGCAGVSVSERHTTALQEKPQQGQGQSPRAAVAGRVEHTTARDDASASLASISAMEAGASLLEPPLLDESLCLLPSLRSCSLATSFGVPGDDDERAATVLSNAVRASEVKSEPLHYPLPSGPICSPRVRFFTSDAVMSQGTLNDTGPAWGLVDTQRTMQTYYDAEVAEAAAQRTRLQELLDQNEALSKATRALLRD